MTEYEINKERLLNSFLEMAKVNAPGQNEKAMADYLIPILEELGFSYKFDRAHKEFNGNCGNLIAYWEGTNPDIEPFFFSAHLDTVLPTKGLKPVIKDDVIYSDGTTILGADDRSAIAAYLEGIRVIQENNIETGPIELILTVNEQAGLVGAKHLDYSLVKSKEGYVFDSTGDVGMIITQGSFSSRIHITINSTSAHIGLNPEDGISAFEIAAEALRNVNLGKITDGLVANIGIVFGGEFTSIIPGKVTLSGEVRSFTKEGLDDQLEHMKHEFEKAAKDRESEVEVEFEKKYSGFKISDSDKLLQIAKAATESLDVHTYTTPTLGGADTNVLNENNLKTLTFGNGYKNLHTFREYIPIDQLNKGAELVISIIDKWAENYR